MNKIIVIVCIASGSLLAAVTDASAHGPLYAHGPHVMYQGGFGPNIVVNSGMGYTETEFELEYGVTSNLTMSASIPASTAAGALAAEEYELGGKYRFYADFLPHGTYEAAVIANYAVSNKSAGVNPLNIGVTGGLESTTWYWFASAIYGNKFTASPLKPGNEFDYDFTLGYRPNEVNYYKPDLVLFVEFLGRNQQKSHLNGTLVGSSGGNSWAIAPTFFLTYNNYALRGGVEFQLAHNGFIAGPHTNFKLGIEAHL